jgi:DNA processing protein
MNSFKKDLILLNMVQDIGYIRLQALLDAFDSPGDILKASVRDLKSVKGIGSCIAMAIKSARSDHDIKKEISLVESSCIDIITLFDKNYPVSLKDIYDPPILLYVKGRLDALDELAIAIVGSRRCTYYGMNMADKLASDLVAYGVTIVSGLARGIDTAAHKGAIKGKGRTIAVLGNGLGSIYPLENKALAEKIICNGAIVSEFPMETPPFKQNFPRRNRIISGLSKAVLVVEAAKKSGALITADFALEQGRDVLAVPGMADRLSSTGTNELIKQGAKLIDNANDVLYEIGIVVAHNSARDIKEPLIADDCQKDIYNMLSKDPCHIDTLVQELKINSRQINSALLIMQAKGIIKQMPGKFYTRNI